MPGLAGMIREFDRDALKQQVLRMMGTITSEEGQKSELHVENGFGFGRVAIDALSLDPQPVWNETRDFCIILDGEIYNRDDLSQMLAGRTFRSNHPSDAELVMHAYDEFGDEFAVKLNGVFAAAIWHPREKKLIIVNDRLGQRPIYFSSYAGRFSFASGVRALLVDQDFPRNVDRHAIRQMLSFEYILGNRTLVKNAQLIPPASTLTYCHGDISVRTYWELIHPDVYSMRPMGEYLDGLIHHLRQAIRRQLPGNLTAGINLSGGLDSRMLLGLLSEVPGGHDVRAYTFGIPGCDDIKLAREVARAVGVRHTSMNIRPDYLRDLAEEGIRLTDGMESCSHMHSLANLNYQADQVQVIYTGFLMDYLINPDIQPEWLATFDREETRKFLFNDINNLFKNIALKDLFTDEFMCETAGSLIEDFDVAMNASESANLANWKDKFDIYQWQRRFTKLGDELLRSKVICRTPFNDNDLIQYCLSIPPGLRLHRHIFIEALIQMFYPLAKVPSDKTGYPLVTCGRGILVQLDQQVRWRLRQVGINISEKKHINYVNYREWYRRELRQWLENTLLNQRSLERGYFKESGLRQLVESHMNGEDHTAELGIMLSIEIWHRQFIDIES